MTVMVLVGGKGTRLESVTHGTPKCMVKVEGNPFIYWIMRGVRDGGHRRVIMCTDRSTWKPLIEYLGFKYLGVEVWYSIEPFPLGTGGAVAHALPLVGGKRFLVMNGDTILEGGVPRHPKGMLIAPHPQGNTLVVGERVITYRKSMCTGNYMDCGGVYQRDMFLGMPEVFDMEAVMVKVIEKGGMPTTYIEGYHEIGTPEALESTRRYIHDRVG